MTFSLTAMGAARHLDEQFVVFEYLCEEGGELVAEDASVDNFDQPFFVRAEGGQTRTR